MAHCPEEERWFAAAGGGRPGSPTGSDGSRQTGPVGRVPGVGDGGGGALPLSGSGSPWEVGMTAAAGRTNGPMARGRGQSDERGFLPDDRRQPDGFPGRRSICSERFTGQESRG